MMEALHPDEIAAVLRRHHVGRLASVVAGEPYLVPVTYAYQDGVLYGHSGPGQKLAALRADPRVAFEVDERWEADVWRSVVARGVFEEVVDDQERQAAADALTTAYPDASRQDGAGVFSRIRPTATTGRKVRRSALFRHLADLDAPLLGIDLRAGDELNFPSRTEDERGGRR